MKDFAVQEVILPGGIYLQINYYPNQLFVKLIHFVNIITCPRLTPKIGFQVVNINSNISFANKILF